MPQDEGFLKKQVVSDEMYQNLQQTFKTLNSDKSIDIIAEQKDKELTKTAEEKLRDSNDNKKEQKPKQNIRRLY
jgi:hypothetical protein